MTRETKIGLLVGLGFVIVIGILLTNHITDRNEPTPANLAQGGNNVRGATAVPGAAVTPPPVTIVPSSPPPHAPVSTTELPPSPPPAIVIGPGTSSVPPVTTPPVTTPPLTTTTPPVTTPPVEVAGADGSDRRMLPGTSRLVEIGRLHGTEIVPVGPGTASGTGTGARSVSTHGIEIKAETGDTLSRLAGRYMGGNTKANRDAIAKANPSLAANPDRIIAGQTYLIPVAAPPTPAPAPAVTGGTPTPPVPAIAPAPVRPAVADASSYTVKPGDTLWSIAKEKCGSATAVAKIKELNKDAIGANDTIRAGATLKLPPMAVATIN